VVSYDARNRTAHWVFEHLTKESVRRNVQVNRTKSEFKEDQSIHSYFRSTNADYKVILENKTESNNNKAKSRPAFTSCQRG
jgi:DNA/RNA endonuclease G (NUC1)